MLGKLLDLSNIIIYNLITRTDNIKASLTVIKTNEYLHCLQMDIIDNGNITSNELNERGLQRGLRKLAIKFIRRMKKVCHDLKDNPQFS